jgi:hypothetical protein
MKASIVALLAIRACAGPPSPAVVDLNLTPAADLATLPGIDPPLADSIVDYRRFHGPFTSTAALAHVPAMARRVAALDGSVGITACPCGAPHACVSGVCARAGNRSTSSWLRDRPSTAEHLDSRDLRHRPWARQGSGRSTAVRSSRWLTVLLTTLPSVSPRENGSESAILLRAASS